MEDGMVADNIDKGARREGRASRMSLIVINHGAKFEKSPRRRRSGGERIQVARARRTAR